MVEPGGAACARARGPLTGGARGLGRGGDVASVGYLAGGRGGVLLEPQLLGHVRYVSEPGVARGPEEGWDPRAFPRGPRASPQLGQPEGAEQGAGAGFTAGPSAPLSKCVSSFVNWGGNSSHKSAVKVINESLRTKVCSLPLVYSPGWACTCVAYTWLALNSSRIR